MQYSAPKSIVFTDGYKNAFTVKQKCYFGVQNHTPMRFHFPATTTTYNLVTEYCTIHRAVQYLQSAESIKAGFKPVFDTRAYEKMIYSCCIEMGLEVESVAKGESEFEKESLASLLLLMSNDDRVKHFKVSVHFMIEDFNKLFVDSPIKRGEAYDDFMKDGFVLTDHLLSNVNYYLKNNFQKEVELINSRGGELSYAQAKQKDGKKSIKKIKTAFTVGQLGYLFRLLYDNDFTHAGSLTELSKFIAKYFKTNRTEDIDLANLKNLLSTPLKKDADKVSDWLKDIRIKAINFEVQPIK